MRIRALSLDKGGCHFYRLQVPLTALRRYGNHETTWGDWVSGDMLNDHDVIVVQFLNGEQDLAFVESVAQSPKRPLLVYDVDDDLFTIDDVVGLNGKSVLWADPKVQARVKKYLGLVDLVTVSTPYLADLYRPYAQKIVVLRNAIPDYLMTIPPKQSSQFKSLWTCSTSHLLDARDIVHILDRFLLDCPDAEMHWMGPPSVVGMHGTYTCTPWNQNVHSYLHSGFGAGSVGLAPLAKYRFNLGKSGIKADEYSVWGLPTLASKFDQYKDCVSPGVTGWLIKNQWDFYSKLKLLYENRDLCTKMGQAARESVSERTIYHTWTHWEQAYQEAIDERHRNN